MESMWDSWTRVISTTDIRVIEWTRESLEAHPCGLEHCASQFTNLGQSRTCVFVNHLTRKPGVFLRVLLRVFNVSKGFPTLAEVSCSVCNNPHIYIKSSNVHSSTSSPRRQTLRQNVHMTALETGLEALETLPRCPSGRYWWINYTRPNPKQQILPGYLGSRVCFKTFPLTTLEFATSISEKR